MRGGARVHDASQLPYVKTELESNTVKIFVATLKAPPSRRMGHRTLIVCSALKSKRESARRRCQTRGSYNASGGGPKKIETQTRISQKTLAHAPHFECKRSRPQQNLNPNANQQGTIAHAPHSQCKRWRPPKNEPQTQIRPKTVASCRIHNASGGGPNKIETQTQIRPQTVEHAPHSQCKRWRP